MPFAFSIKKTALLALSLNSTLIIAFLKPYYLPLPKASKPNRHATRNLQNSKRGGIMDTAPTIAILGIR